MKKNRFLVSSLAAIVLVSNANFCLAANPNDKPTLEELTEQSNILDFIKPVTTDRLKVELTTEEDCLSLAKYFKDKGIQDTFGMGREISESEALETLKRTSSNSLSTGLMKIFTIKTLENEPIGQVWIGLKEINTPNCITISSWLGKPFWGKSFAPEAVCALLSQVDVPNIDIAINVSSTNEKSKRAILKTGERLGVFIKDSNGEYIPQAPEKSKFYLKEKNIYRYVCDHAEEDDSQLNIKSYKNDVLLSEQNIFKGMFPENLFKDSSGIEYIFSKTLI